MSRQREPLYIAFSFYNFHDYPNAIVATADNRNEKNQFFLNGILAGNSNGFCVTLRDEEQAEIKLANSSKEQSVLLTNKLRLNISQPRGDDLGLKIIRANADEKLRKEFGCEA